MRLKTVQTGILVLLAGALLVYGLIDLNLVIGIVGCVVVAAAITVGLEER